MARAHFADVLIGTSGTGALSLLDGATVHVYDQGTTTPISQTLYAADSGGTTIANPLTSDANGKVEFWLNTPARVDLAASKTGFSPSTRTVDVESAPSGGGSGVQVVGPFSVNWDDADIGNGATAGKHLADLDEGTLVIRAWAFVTETFTPNISTTVAQIVIGNPDGDWDVLVAYYQGAPYGPSAGIALEQATNANVVRDRRAGRLNVAGSLRAWVQSDDPLTAGHMEVYALVLPPVS